MFKINGAHKMTSCDSCPYLSAMEAEDAIKTNIILLREHEIRMLQDQVIWLKASLKINSCMTDTDKQHAVAKTECCE